MIARATLYLLILALLLSPVSGQTARYQMIRVNDNRGWFWTWSAEKPYTSLGVQCWDDTANTWCESNFNPNRKNLLYVIIDHSPDAPYHYGSLYQEAKRNGRCFVWFWHDDYGADGNPHMATIEWVRCPNATV